MWLHHTLRHNNTVCVHSVRSLSHPAAAAAAAVCLIIWSSRVLYLIIRVDEVTGKMSCALWKCNGFWWIDYFDTKEDINTSIYLIHITRTSPELPAKHDKSTKTAFNFLRAQTQPRKRRSSGKALFRLNSCKPTKIDCCIEISSFQGAWVCVCVVWKWIKQEESSLCV